MSKIRIRWEVGYDSEFIAETPENWDEMTANFYFSIYTAPV